MSPQWRYCAPSLGCRAGMPFLFLQEGSFSGDCTTHKTEGPLKGALLIPAGEGPVLPFPQKAEMDLEETHFYSQTQKKLSQFYNSSLSALPLMCKSPHPGDWFM